MLTTKIRLIVATCLLLCLGTAAAQPYTIEENRLPAHSSIISQRTAKSALEGLDKNSANYISLSGEWNIEYFNSKEDIDTEKFDRHYNSNKSKVNVPHSWVVDGTATYSQSAYPMLSAEPKRGEFPIPTNSKCALYLRDFTIPFDFTDRKQYITIGGASGKATLYINGEVVGFSTDSKNPAQYDISAYTNRGLNRIAVVVEEFSGASWVEDHSGWRLSGLNRDVYLYVQPKIRVRDVVVSTSLDPSYSTGLLQTALLLKSELLNEHTVTVFYDLYDPSGNIIRKENRDVSIDMRGEDTVRFHSSINDVEQWNSETPNLYTAVFSIKRSGRYTEYASVKIGFREVKIEGTKLLINGKAPLIKGVNIEEFSADRGNVLREEDVVRTLEEMKHIGINAIRTGGYPMPQYFYDLTDSMGFYVVNTANLNTQGLENSRAKGLSLANDPKWVEVYKSRAITAYERTKRNPSVIAIALGEDAGNGFNTYESYLELKRRNENLVVIYDGAASEWNTDIITPLYPTLSDIKKISKTQATQPIIPARVKFNEQYWNSEQSQGAFIDRWIPQNLELKAKFKELSDSYKLSSRNSGKVTESSAQSSIKEIKRLFIPIEVEVVNRAEGTYRVTNSLDYSNLSELKCRYRVHNGSRVSEWKSITINCEVGKSCDIELEKLRGSQRIEIEIGGLYLEVL